jgi:hypothetical protein
MLHFLQMPLSVHASDHLQLIVLAELCDVLAPLVWLLC